MSALTTHTRTQRLMRAQRALGALIMALTLGATGLTATSVQAAERDQRGSQRPEQRDDDRPAGPGGQSGRGPGQDKERERENDRGHERDSNRDDDRDHAKVQVSLTTPVSGAIYTAPATVTLTASAQSTQKNHPVTHVEFYHGATLIGTATAVPYSVTWNAVPAGSYRLTAKAYTDKADKRDAKDKDEKAKDVAISAPVDIIVNAVPTISLTSPTANAVANAPGSFTLTANATDSDGTIAKVEFYNGTALIGSATSAPYTATWSNIVAGSYSLTARAADNLGATTTSAAVPVTVNALPVISLVTSGAPYVAPANATLTATAADADGTIAKVEFYNGTTLIGTLTSAPYALPLTALAAGSYSLTAIATDNQGGTSTSAPVVVAVAPNQLPAITLTSPTPNLVAAAPATVTIAANATDVDGTITKVDFYQTAILIGTATTAPYTVTWSNVPSGSYSLTAVATDDKGGTTTSAAVPITIDTPPTVTLTSPSAGSVGIAPASFTLTATATDSDGTIAKVEFYNGATLIGTATTSPYALVWDNVTPGNYILTALATDNLGLQTTSPPINVSVIANSPPAISLTSPTQNQSFKAPASVTLTATASDPDNNLAKVEFLQNGTLIATLLTPPYTTSWSSVGQGSYQITAIATDAIGAQATSAATTITVTPAQASLYFIHPDHLGTPRLVTDEANAVVWRHLPTTEPFGNTPPEEDPNATGNRFEMPLAFPGQYRDRESNLNYNYFRDYDPFGGRYRQSDPIGIRGGINTYTYVNGNPVSYSDPLGNCPSCLAAVLGAGFDVAVQVGASIHEGQSFGQAVSNINYTQTLVAAAASAVGAGALGVGADLVKSRALVAIPLEALTKAQTGAIADLVVRTEAAAVLILAKKAIGDAYPYRPFESPGQCKK